MFDWQETQFLWENVLFIRDDGAKFNKLKAMKIDLAMLVL